LEEEESKILVLKGAIKEGFERGIANIFNPKRHLEKLKAETLKNG